MFQLSIVFVFAICFSPAYLFTRNHFYINGAYFWDSGLFAWLNWHNIAVRHPRASGGGYYFATHFSPLHSMFSALSYLTPLDAVSWYCLVQGTMVGLLGVGVYMLLVAQLWQPRTWPATLISIVTAWLVAYGGVSLSTVVYPHFEIFFVVFALFFFCFLIKGYRVAAAISFVLCMATREDSGFHLFGFLFMYVLWFGVIKGEWNRAKKVWPYTLIAFLISVVIVFVIQKRFFPGDDSLRRVYLGTGSRLFAHVTFESTKHRLMSILENRHYVTLPSVVIVVWATVSRKPQLVLGLLAVIPWVGINLVSVYETPATMSVYYTFPLLLSFIFPLIVSKLEREEDQWPLILSFFCVQLASAIGYWLDVAPGSFGPERLSATTLSALLLSAIVVVVNASPIWARWVRRAGVKFVCATALLLGTVTVFYPIFKHSPSFVIRPRVPPEVENEIQKICRVLKKRPATLGTVTVDGAVASFCPDTIVLQELLVTDRAVNTDTFIYWKNSLLVREHQSNMHVKFAEQFAPPDYILLNPRGTQIVIIARPSSAPLWSQRGYRSQLLSHLSGLE